MYWILKCFCFYITEMLKKKKYSKAVLNISQSFCGKKIRASTGTRGYLVLRTPRGLPHRSIRFTGEDPETP